jgi:ACS family hexuronate transporter-like MFS transporter
MNMPQSGPLAPGSSPPLIDPWRWGIVWLMFLATMINYMDRQTMQVTSTHMVREFTPQFAAWGFGPKEGYGVVEAAFNYAFAIGQIIAGLLADRWSLRWAYAAALLVWSAAGLCTGLADTLAILLLCRIVLGAGEAFNWPCAVHVVKRVVPRESRSLANGIFHSGASIGAATMPLLAVAVIGPNGERWRWLFIGVGAIGGLWAVLWFAMIRGPRAAIIDQPAAEEKAQLQHGPKPPFWHIFALDRFWLALTYGTAVNVCWHFFRVWLPPLLISDLKLGETAMLWVVAGFFVAADIGSMTAGWVTRRLTRSGYSIAASRKIVMIGTSTLCLLAIPVALLHGAAPSAPGSPAIEDAQSASAQLWITIPLIMIVAAGAMGGFANYFALTQEVSAHHTSFVVGVVGAGAWFVLAIINPLIGRWADQTGSLASPVLAVGFVPLAGALIAALLWRDRDITRNGSVQG